MKTYFSQCKKHDFDPLTGSCKKCATNDMVFRVPADSTDHDPFDSDAGRTQFCPSCEHTAKKLEEFKVWLEGEGLKLKHGEQILTKLRELGL